MPRTGTPSSSIFGSQTGASLSYTELGPPDSTIPTGSCARISARLAVHGRIAENTCCSRMRRAMSCVYWPPKSSTTIPCFVLTMPPCSFAAAAPRFGAIISPSAFSSLDVSYALSPTRTEASQLYRRRRTWMSLTQHDIHKLFRHNHNSHDFFADQKRGDVRVAQRAFSSLVLAQVFIHQHLSAQSPVDLNDDLDLIFPREVLAVCRPLLPGNCARI